jgi:hypothetical protein
VTYVIGPEGVLKAVTARLSLALPDYIAAHAAELYPHRDDDELALDEMAFRSRFLEKLTPKLIAPSERKNLSLNDYPAILVVPDNITEHQTLYVDNSYHPGLDTEGEPQDPIIGGITFGRVYQIRLWVYFHGEASFDDTSRWRNRLEFCVWRCIFDQLQLADNAKTSANSYEVNFSSVAGDAKGQRSMAGYYAATRNEATELLSTPEIYAADTLSVLEAPL